MRAEDAGWGGAEAERNGTLRSQRAARTVLWEGIPLGRRLRWAGGKQELDQGSKDLGAATEHIFPALRIFAELCSVKLVTLYKIQQKDKTDNSEETAIY